MAGGAVVVINCVRPGIAATSLCIPRPPVEPLPEVDVPPAATLARGRGADAVVLVVPELIAGAEVGEAVVERAVSGAAIRAVPALFVIVDVSFVAKLVFSISVVVVAVPDSELG